MIPLGSAGGMEKKSPPVTAAYLLLPAITICFTRELRWAELKVIQVKVISCQAEPRIGCWPYRLLALGSAADG